MKTIVKIIAIGSLAACLAVAASFFLRETSEATYRTALMLFTLLYFVSATIWSESKR